MYPGTFAASVPDRPAIVAAGTGEVVTHRGLDQRSRRLARALRDRGLRRGDTLAVFLENHPRYFEVVWAGLRSGLYVTTINRYLTAGEADYILEDSGAGALVSSATLAPVAEGLSRHASRCKTFLMVDGIAPGFESYENVLSETAEDPLDEEPAGALLLYSSGTTGRPKGIHRSLPDRSIQEGIGPIPKLLRGLFGFGEDSVYLSTAPLYHSAPLGFAIGTQALGGTVVMMEHFGAVAALRAIEEHRVTHSQWVPAMFIRLLKLDEAERVGHDLSSHRVAIHGAAPCPLPVKEQMLEWWGPIVHEYYGGTELNGMTYVGPQEWREHPGTVGRPVLGKLHICDEGGEELPPGEPGLVYFELPGIGFEYLNDPESTHAARHPDHPTWSALGDVGYVDADGYLYLTDRATFMIISGGVNIYPQEIEDVLVMHPLVADVAVVGVPNDEMGEEVKAIVEPVADAVPGPDLAQAILAYARAHLAGFKVPKSVDFEDSLPRLPTGKLYKRALRDRYWEARESRLV